MDNVWHFMIEQGTFKMESESVAVDKVQIIAADGMSIVQWNLADKLMCTAALKK